MRRIINQVSFIYWKLTNIPTPAGTKNKARLSFKNLEVASTFYGNLTILVLKL